MDGLIILLILIPIVFLLLLLSLHIRSGEQRRLLESLYDRIKELSGEVVELSQQLKTKKERTAEEPLPATAVTPRPEKEKQIPAFVPLPEEEIPAPVIEVPEPEKEKIAVLPEERMVAACTADKEPSKQPQQRDIEKFIGENIANKIGIAVLVLGIAFFVKYAIDKNWIGETGRVIIGFVSGGLLIGLAHYIRNSYRSFSSVLAGGGLAVFYFTVAFAFHQYQLISQATAFISMVIISAFAVLLSLFYKRQELAILATIGGFITPFLVSTGQENYIALFTYLCILNAGLIALSWFKRWPAINIISLFFTTIIFGGWLIKRTVFEDPSSLPYADGFLFATLFYLLFMAMNIINAVRLRKKISAFDFILVLSSNFLYYAAGMVLLSYQDNNNYEGLFTAGLGVFNLALAYIFSKRKNTDRNFIALLTGLAVSFISLTAPVHFKGNHVVMFWAAESILLFVLYLRTKTRLLKIASDILTTLMLGSLFLVWVEIYFWESSIIPVLLNKGFITSFIAAAALLTLYKLEEKDDQQKKSVGKTKQVVLMLVLYFTGAFETAYQFSSRFPGTSMSVIYLQLYTYCLFLLLLWLFRKERIYPLLRLILTALSVLIFLAVIPVTNKVSTILSVQGPAYFFLVHWVSAGLLLWLLYTLIPLFIGNTVPGWTAYRKTFAWLIAAASVLIFSVELFQLDLWVNFRNPADWPWWENLYYKAGLSILWGLCSFALMWLGMKKNYQPLRIISLSLFTITMVKLFLYDIRNMPPGSKIAAFILLGILLLAVSFMYQRLKKIIIDKTGEE